LGVWGVDGLAGLAAGAPAEVLIIRHAEQPARGSQVHLSAVGRTRAAALPSLFPARFAAPTVLFATRPSKESSRPLETLQPLAKALRLPIDDRFADDAYAQLASTILTGAGYAGARILICWHHGTIPGLAAALGAVHAPARWPEAQYDHVWQLRYGAGAVTFDDRLARLLSGDRDDPAGQIDGFARRAAAADGPPTASAASQSRGVATCRSSES
jgi:broad specificity phosphatase PhoE